MRESYKHDISVITVEQTVTILEYEEPDLCAVISFMDVKMGTRKNGSFIALFIIHRHGCEVQLYFEGPLKQGSSRNNNHYLHHHLFKLNPAEAGTLGQVISTEYPHCLLLELLQVKASRPVGNQSL